MRADTSLREFLNLLQLGQKKRALLVGEYVMHPDNVERKAPEINLELEKRWEIMRRDLKKVLGVELCPWGRLVSDASFDLNVGLARGAADPYLISMGELKKKADRARLGDPSILFLKDMVFEAP